MTAARRSLADILTATGPMPWQQTIPIVQAMLRALRYLHTLGHVHRDIKPPNILEHGDGFVLGDLGIVKWSELNPAFTNAGTLTRASMQLGSWFYMAPEQQDSPHDATPASDIYALGITWIEMLTGSHLTPAKVAANAFPDPCLHPLISSTIRRMVRYRPEDRPSIDELVATTTAIGFEPERPT